jgi:hypothetical protein
MAAYSLTEFYESVRTLLGDEGDSVAGFDYTDAQISGALRSVVRMGFLPCLALATGSNPETLTDAPPNPDTWGFLAAKAAHILIGGALQESIKTRAIAVSVNPLARRDAVFFLETMLSDLDARGNLCGTAEDTAHKGLFATQGDVMTYIGFPAWPCVTPSVPLMSHQPSCE